MTDRRLSCPGCGVLMAIERSRGVAVDCCGGCRGIWFDAGELGASVGKPLPPLERKGSSPRACTACGAPMELARMGRVEVDACGKCRGIYLDAGELSRLIPIRASRRSKAARNSGTAVGAVGAAADGVSVVLSIFQLLG